MPFCTNCGAKLEGVEQFCPFCGERFEMISEESKPTPSTQIDELKDEVHSLRRQLEEERKPIIPPQKKQEFECWQCCCLIFIIMMLIGFLPWFIFF